MACGSCLRSALRSRWGASSLALLIASSTVWPAVAGETPTSEPTTTTAQRLDLDSVVAEILDRNPEIKFYSAEIAAARGGARTAGTWPNPEAAGTVGDKRVTGDGPAGEGVTWSVSLKMVFEWPGRISLRKAIANQQIGLAELGFEQFKAALTTRARTVAFALAVAEQKADAAQEVADRFRALREVLVQRDPAGITPQLEARVIEATAISMLRRASDAALAGQAAMLEVNQLRGVPWAQTLRVMPAELTFIPPPSMDALLAAAQKNNFDILMRRVELEQQGFKVALARNERYPAFSVGPYVLQERARDREQQFGLAVSVPLPLWNRNEGNIETAAARQKQAETSMYVTQRSVERQVAEKTTTYQTKLTEIQKWRPESVSEFRKAAELADRHYRLGAVPIATYVELQRQYLDAAEALLEARHEAFEAAQQLELLTGLEIKAVHTTIPIRSLRRPPASAGQPAKP